ncbi:MAG: hypothetical protein KTQ13_08815 [Ferruginibacter sp.]|nr:hypothetical protein [Chitinophagaceae bacterium]MBP6287334.1 hypothetical protein [Ferruginibacter sp.]MBU9936739.1 hypothetical protein [Ferruginibacter sp.]
MPRSKKRKHHHDFHPHAGVEKSKKNKSAVLLAVIVCGIIGLGIAFFVSDSDPLWLVSGAVLGAGLGYFAGKQFDNTFSKG